MGFFALSAGVMTAFANPATNYELSIYRGTPDIFWIGWGIALLVSVFASILTDDARLRGLGVFLGGCGITVFAGLPVVRGYYFFGSGDTLTHLGWIRDIASGALNPIDLFYPGVHSLSVLISTLTGFRLERSGMMIVIVFVLVYLSFVALFSRVLMTGVGAVVGAISGFHLLPINIVMTQVTVHPISMASLFFVLILFVFFKYVTEPHSESSGRITATGVLLALTTSATVLYHPQQASVVLVLFGTVSAVQFVARWRSATDRIAETRTMYAQTIFLAIVFVLWTTIHEGLTNQVAVILSSMYQTVFASGGDAGAVVSQRSTSLADLGTSPLVIFLKLFLVSAIYSVFAGLVMLFSFVARLDNAEAGASTLITYVTYGFVVLVPFSLLQFFGDTSRLFFRYHASMMVIATLLGAYGIAYFAVNQFSPMFRRRRRVIDPFGDDSFVRQSRATKIRHGVVGGALSVMLLLSLVAVFPSPYLIQPSLHMTEMQAQGYNDAFALTGNETELTGAGMPPWRYRHALKGTSGNPWGPSRVPPQEYDHDVTGYLRVVSADNGALLAFTRYDRLTATVTYDGLHFSQTDFRELETTPGIDRVYSSGEFELYYTKGLGNTSQVNDR